MFVLISLACGLIIIDVADTALARRRRYLIDAIPDSYVRAFTDPCLK